MPRKILVVDDNPAMIGLISESLSQAGFTVLSAGNGAEALTAVAASEPDLVVLDLVMPVVNGMEVLRTLRSRRGTESLPVIVLTGKDAPEAMLEGWMGGADRYITKPCSMHELLSAVEDILIAPAKQ